MSANATPPPRRATRKKCRSSGWVLVFALILLMLAGWTPVIHAAWAAAAADAVEWYDTLGFPSAKDLPYVRVATGLWMQRGNQPPENRFAEGFLVSEDADSFTVFICGVSDLKDMSGMRDPYPSLTTVRFVRKATGPAHTLVGYEALDFAKVSTEVLERVRLSADPKAARSREDARARGVMFTQRSHIFAFARACLQKGLTETASELMDIVANIADEQTGKPEPQMLRDKLQRQMGEAVLRRAEGDFAKPALSWEELRKPFEQFSTRYPASPKVAYAQECADVLAKMIAEDAAHRPKPLEQMTPAEQAAENIYQLRNLRDIMWIMHQPYPVYARKVDGQEVKTPVHRLVDLGDAAVPALIEALDDRRFTHSLEMNFHGQAPPMVTRVGLVAQRILEHLSGRNLYPRKTDDGKLIAGTTRQQAEAWWAEKAGKGERQQLIEATSAGGNDSRNAARKLVEKYPDAAIEAIEAGRRQAKLEAYRGEFVEIAGQLPGDMPLAFLRSKLGPGNGLYSQVRAAEALLARGQPDAVPAMIEAWRKVQPRLPTDEADAWSEVGGLIAFLATSKDARAIDALGQEGKGAPVEVRLAVVQVFLPWPKTHGGSSAVGKSVSVSSPSRRDELRELPAGEAGEAIERLLITALDDRERRYGLKGTYNEASYEDPRVCDMAATVLAQRWPEKYRFQWAAQAAECDGQISQIRSRWRADHQLAPAAEPARVVIPAAPQAAVASLLDAFAAATDDDSRSKVTTQIAGKFGLAALPAVRARHESSKDAAFQALAVQLAGFVRDVRVEADAGDAAAKSAVASLKGQSLDGERLYRLACDLESGLPPDVRAMTFRAERAGDGTGFQVTIGWLAGALENQTGWDREMAIRAGTKNVHDQTGYSASRGGMRKEAEYRRMADAFEKAIQSEIDAPISVRLRIQRSRR